MKINRDTYQRVEEEIIGEEEDWFDKLDRTRDEWMQGFFNREWMVTGLGGRILYWIRLGIKIIRLNKFKVKPFLNVNFKD